jgi:hypothetical protein
MRRSEKLWRDFELDFEPTTSNNPTKLLTQALNILLFYDEEVILKLPRLHGHVIVVRGDEIVDLCYPTQALREKITQVQESEAMKEQISDPESIEKMKRLGDLDGEDYYGMYLQASKFQDDKPPWLGNIDRVGIHIERVESNLPRLQRPLAEWKEYVRKQVNIVFPNGYTEEQLHNVLNEMKSIVPPDACIALAILHTMVYPGTEVAFAVLFFEDKVTKERYQEYPPEGSRVFWVRN